MRTLFAMLFLTACSPRLLDTDPADTELCTELRDHLVDLRVSEAQGVDVAAHHAALVQALGTTFVGKCASTLTTQQARCALAAPSVATAAQCSTPDDAAATNSR